MSLVGFQASEIWMSIWKITAELVWKSFSRRNNSLEPPVFFHFLIVFYLVLKRVVNLD